MAAKKKKISESLKKAKDLAAKHKKKEIEFSVSTDTLDNDTFLSIIESEKESYPVVAKRGTKKSPTKYYYSIASSFDIETYSWMDDEEKVHACLVCWQFGINGHATIGRDWDSFKTLLKKIQEILELSSDLRLPSYVHNLSHEFQWTYRVLTYSEVFSTKDRNPIRAMTNYGIEFRDSYILTNCSLEDTAKNELTKYKYKKQTGKWDYNKARHSQTPLTPDEIEYAVYDVIVVMCYIQEQIENRKGIHNIPMTKTGFVREKFKKATLNGPNSFKYKKMIEKLTIDPEEYQFLKEAFQGGLTHANATYVGKTLENVRSYDFISEYPSVMVCEKFPMGIIRYMFQPKSKKQFFYLIYNYCCLFEVTFINITSKNKNERILSMSKCKVEGCYKTEDNIDMIDNGRLVEADSVTTTITEQDFFNISNFYKFSDFEINWMIQYKTNYLPTEIINTVLELYEYKTILKGTEDELEYLKYMISKGMLNSSYGMCVTDPVKECKEFDNQEGWVEPEHKPISTYIEGYNNSKNRFLYYPWGVWVSAYARRNLCKCILAAGDNYVYSDTDSTKYLTKGINFEEFVTSYNKEIDSKMEAALKHHGFPLDSYKKTTRDGKIKPLGYLDFDGDYTKFKTLGAKRYLVEEKGEVKATIAGTSKKGAKAFFKTTSDPFEAFRIGLRIPETYSGRLTSYYIDEKDEGEIVDYLGESYRYTSPTSLALIPSAFTMSVSKSFDAFVRFFQGVSYEIEEREVGF